MKPSDAFDNLPPAPAGFEYADDMTEGRDFALDGWQRLAQAIIMQSYYDYISAVFYNDTETGGGYRARTTKAAEEAFYSSPFFGVLCHVNPSWLIAHAHKQVALWKAKARKVLLTDFISGTENKDYNAAFPCPICRNNVYVRLWKHERRCLCNYCRIAITESEVRNNGANAKTDAAV